MGNGKVAAGFVIFKRLNEKIEYLLLQASYEQHHWTPPKGHVESGEDEWQTAIRETAEEAGLNINDLKVFKECKKELNYLVKGKPKRVVYWLAELISSAQVKLSNEHQDFKWLPLEKACKYAAYPDMIETLNEFDTFINAKSTNTHHD